jgi:hypothetical protein
VGILRRAGNCIAARIGSLAWLRRISRHISNTAYIACISHASQLVFKGDAGGSANCVGTMPH